MDPTMNDSYGSLENTMWDTESNERVVYQATNETRLSELACYFWTVEWIKFKGL